MKLFCGLILLFCLGCQQPLSTQFGLSAQLKASLAKKNAAVVALAKQLESVSDDTVMRSTWNDTFKSIEDAYSSESSAALKAGLSGATTAASRKQLWQEVQTAYGP